METHKKIKPKERRNDLQIFFGMTVRKRRIELELSQEKLAELSGLHFTYVSSVERGERNISLINIAKLANALDCNIRDFF